MGLCLEKFSKDLTIDYLLSNNEYRDIPLLNIEQAIQPLISILPNIEIYVQLVKDKCHHPIDGLTSDQFASIMLYSMRWQPYDQCLYTILNATLQKLTSINIQPWLLYLKLLFTSLIHLPSHDLIVYRGSQFDLSSDYPIDGIISWTDLPLCTSSMEYLQSNHCTGGKQLQTIFYIHCQTAKNIEKYCYHSSKDLFVFLPGTNFEVLECIKQENENYSMIRLREIQSSFLLHFFEHRRSILNTPITSNVFQRFCTLFQSSTTDELISKDRYRNPLLEQRIVNYDHSWTLDLDRQNLTDRDMRIVVKYALIKNHCKRIRLRENQITWQGTAILAKGISHNTRLESLDLRANYISDIGVQYLSNAVIYSNLKTLNLESNEINADGAQYLAQMIRDSRTLAELYLSKNHLGDRGIELLANVLCNTVMNSHEQSNKDVHQSALQHLYLGQNDITDEGLKHLANMLRTNRTLTWLWLTGNEISNDGIEYLAPILADWNLTLEWLFLNSNKLIDDFSLNDFIHILKRNHTLKTLYLNNCSLSEITKRKLLQITKTKKDFDLEV